MASTSKFIILGNIGKKPVAKYTPNGQAITMLNIAENKVWKDKNGNKNEKTDWYYVKVFGKQAEICAQYLEKGSQVYVEGPLGSHTYDKNGESIYSLDLNAKIVHFCGSKPNNGNDYQDPSQKNFKEKQQVIYADNVEFADGEIPF